jgi:hypothetical protein
MLEAEVERRVEEELEAVLELLERELSREEFIRAAKILAYGDEEGR